MSSILPAFFSLLLMISCGQHNQVSSGSDGVKNTNQVINPDALSQNIMDEDLASIDKYLRSGGSIEFELSNGRTLLTEACFWMKYKTITFLLGKKADLNFKDRFGKSPFDYAEEEIKIKRIFFPELLMELKINLFLQAKNNQITELKKTLDQNPPLNFFISSLEMGPDVESANGETLLTYCVKNKLESVLRLLAQPKLELDANLKNVMGESPLKLARDLKFLNIEKLLVKLGAVE